MKSKIIDYIKEKRLLLLILLFSIFITSSFDIILNFELYGFTFRVNQLLCIFLFIYYLYTVIKYKKINWILGWKPLLIWCGILLTFTFNTVLPSVNIGYHLWLIFNVFLIFAVVGVVNDKKFANTVFKLYVTSFAIIAIVGIVQFVLGCLGVELSSIRQWWIPGYLPRVNGFCYEPSYYATYMLIGWVMTRVLVMNKEEKNRKLLFGFLFFDTLAILISSSRIGIAFMLFFEGINWIKNLVVSIKKKNKNIVRLLIIDVVVVVVLFLVYVTIFMVAEINKKNDDVVNAANQEILQQDLEGNVQNVESDIQVQHIQVERLQDEEISEKVKSESNEIINVLLNGTGIGDTANHSVSYRMSDLMNVLTVFQQSPILGKGLGGIYAQIAENLGCDPNKVSVQDVSSGMSVFAEVLAASGIIGFVFFAMYILVLIIKPLNLARKKDGNSKYILLALVLALIVEFGILQFNQNILRPYLWIHIAMLSMFYFIIKNNKETDNEQLKVAVDARMINMSGIGTYIQNLMKNECYNVALGKKEEIYQVDNKIKVIDFDSNIYGIKEQLKFPYIKLLKENVDVLHVPHYNIPIFYSGKLVVTIHDLTHLIYKEFLPNKFAYFYAKFMIWLALKKADTVLTVSENTKKDILNLFRVKADKIKVIYNGVSSDFRRKSKDEIEYLYEKYSIDKDKKLLMYVGNLKPHKNLERLLEAYSKINNIEDTRLLLVGKAFENYNVLGDKEEKLNIKDKVIHTGIVSHDELVDLYNLVDLFVFPSLYEGFGLPVLEALACGTRVIASNSSSIPEVGGDLIEYFNPKSVEEMVVKIQNNIGKELDLKKTEEWIKNFQWSELCGESKSILKNY